MNNINDIVLKIDSLEKQINLVQNNVHFTLGLTWTILGVVVAIIGIALYFLAKMWFDKRFAEESKKIDEKIKKFVVENPPVLYSKAEGSILIWTGEKDNCKYYEIQFCVNSEITKSSIIFCQFYYVLGSEKMLIDCYDVKVVNKTVYVIFKSPNNQNYVNVGYVIMWRNPIYFDPEDNKNISKFDWSKDIWKIKDEIAE